MEWIEEHERLEQEEGNPLAPAGEQEQQVAWGEELPPAIQVEDAQRMTKEETEQYLSEMLEHIDNMQADYNQRH